MGIKSGSERAIDYVKKKNKSREASVKRGFSDDVRQIAKYYHKGVFNTSTSMAAPLYPLGENPKFCKKCDHLKECCICNKREEI